MLPLADKIRPQNIAEYVGQTNLVGEGKPLRLTIEFGKVFFVCALGIAGSWQNFAAGKKDIRKIIGEESDKPRLYFLAIAHDCSFSFLSKTYFVKART
ncbi:MAG: hypothetical protein MUC29_09340 [Pyrinomonadaceae bacterium]|jgi:replication-associated recombination protein RarA|nr:hypothetical protein [Pyrinomonadaceae bacterium]